MLFSVFAYVTAIWPSKQPEPNYFFSGMLTHYCGLHISQSADAGTSE